MIYAIVLAAGGGLTEDSELPKSLLKIGKRTLLERQINILKWCGLDEQQIYVVIGKDKKYWTPENISFVKKMFSNVIVNDKNLETGSSYSLYLALKSLSPSLNDTLLIMDGDVIFEKETIYSLLKSKYDNILLASLSYNISPKSGKIMQKNDTVFSAGSSINIKSPPFYEYSGVCKISAKNLDILMPMLIKYRKKHLIDVLGKIARKIRIYVLDREIVKNETEPTFLVGGSGAKLRRIVLIRKEAWGKRAEKLINEIRWLLNLPHELKPFFPEVLEYKIRKNYARLDMPYYDIPSIRRLIFSGEIDADKAIEILTNLIDFMFKFIYSRKYGKGDISWIYRLHFNRIVQRWHETIVKAPVFEKILKAKEVYINNKKYRNAPEMFQIIKTRPTLLEDLSPKIITMVHGDLHFQNILVNVRMNNKYNFILTDPRGEIRGSDFIYDFGKLWHSFHGLYDFMHENLFILHISSLDEQKIEAKLAFNNICALDDYMKISRKMPSVLKDFDPLTRIDPLWYMRTLFTEAVHFCTLMPFHLKNDGKEEKAIAMYLTGVKLLNEFIEKFKIIDQYNEEKEWINVNTLEDYIKAKKKSISD